MSKRPSGILIVAVLWTIGSIANLIRGLYIIVQDIGTMPLLTYYLGQYEAFRFLLPAETVLHLILVLTAILGLYATFGLYTAKSWSYYATLVFPVFAAVVYTVLAAMYLSLPAEIAQLMIEYELGLVDVIVFNVLAAFFAWVWTIIMWVYVNQSYVKQYLNRMPTPAPVSAPVPLSTVPTVISEGKKFCRYCGAENKTDADFCEKCGKKIG